MSARSILLLSLLLVAGCGTPQEQCRRNATTELNKLNRLIAETEGNLSRGFAYEERRVTSFHWVGCVGGAGGHTGASLCLDPFDDTVRREVAIDPAVEQRKLANLKAKHAAITRQAAEAVAQCKATYPEG
ncbi:MAG: hypothetical protein WBA91_08550 [Paracoccaceae bacterium]